MSSSKSSNFKNIRANRKAFSKRIDTLPAFFSWILEGQIAGMAFPTEREQVISFEYDKLTF